MREQCVTINFPQSWYNFKKKNGIGSVEEAWGDEYAFEVKMDSLFEKQKMKKQVYPLE